MRSVTITARTREEAINEALAQLGVERHEVAVEILDEGSPGFFGIGARDVKVRVSVEELPDTGRAAPPEEPGERPRIPRPKPSRRERPEPRPTPSRGEVTSISALLEEMIRLMGLEAKVTSSVTEEGDTVLLVESPDSALLIGRKGRNLQALQYLVNRVVANDSPPEASGRILVDIEGYTDRRKASLEDLAFRLAARVKETGRRIRIKPLSPQERRIIHVVLQDDPDVRTYSVGEAPLRCVVIAPRNERPRRGVSPGRPRPRRSRGAFAEPQGHGHAWNEQKGP